MVIDVFSSAQRLRNAVSFLRTLFHTLSVPSIGTRNSQAFKIKIIYPEGVSQDLVCAPTLAINVAMLLSCFCHFVSNSQCLQDRNPYFPITSLYSITPCSCYANLFSVRILHQYVLCRCPLITVSYF